MRLRHQMRIKTYYNAALFVLFFLVGNDSFGQVAAGRMADSLYEEKHFAEAGTYYLKAVEESEFKARKKSMYYNAACCFALAGKKDSALLLLKRSFSGGGVNIENVKSDSDLASLHNLPSWHQLLSSVTPAQSSTGDPAKVHLVTSDIENFGRLTISHRKILLRD
jgi:hypothetical protein